MQLQLRSATGVRHTRGPAAAPAVIGLPCSIIRAPPAPTRRLSSSSSSSRRLVTRAEKAAGDGGGKGDSTPGGGTANKYAAMVEELAKAGLTPAKAKNVLKAWSQLGAQDPEKLRALLVERRLKTFRGLLLQTVLDFVACGGGFYIGKVSGESNIPGSIIFSLLGYFLACYYFLQAVFQVTALTSISVAAKRYATDTDVLLAAVRELAGPEPGGLFPSASLVVNTLKVIQTLEQIGEQLQVLGSTAGSVPRSSLANLSAYLALQRAEEVYGFDPSAFGLTESEAADIAGVFSRFDSNEDGRLEAAELRNLCGQLGTDISDAEAKEAVRILDEGGTGFIQFSDFVLWYQGVRPSKEAKQRATSSSSSSSTTAASTSSLSD